MSGRLQQVRSGAGRAPASMLLHGLGAVGMGAGMLSESRAGYVFPVFDGPRAILGFLPDPITGWGALFLAGGVLLLAFRGRPAGRAALVALAAAWATFGAGALVLALSSADAAIAGAVMWLLVAADAARAALEYPGAPEGGGGAKG